MTRAAVWYGFLALLVLAPLPFASNRSWSWSLLGLFTALLLIGWLVLAVRGRIEIVWRPFLWFPLVAFVGVVGWAVVQAALPLDLAAAPPLWGAAAEALGRAVEPRLSLAPDAAWPVLLRWCTYAAAFWLALQFGRDAARAWQAIRWFVVASAAYALYGLVNYMAGNELLLWYPRIAYHDDLTSTFVNRNSYATFAMFGLIATLALAGHEYAARYRLTDRSAARSARVVDALLWVPFLYGIAALLLAMAWLQTHSRMGFAAGIVGLVTFSLFLRAQNGVFGRILPLFGVIVAGAFLLFSSGSGTLSRIGETQSSDRFPLFEMVWRGIENAPLTGYGLGSFPSVFNMFRDSGYAPGKDFTEAHNSYLELAFELGLPATAILLAIILSPVAANLRALYIRRQNRAFPLIAVAATATAATHTLVDFPLQMPATAYAFATLLGLGTAQSWSQRGRG
jgi:O-antigen ligase